MEAFVDLLRLELGAGERLGDILQLDEPTLQVARRTRQLLELRFLGLARRRVPLQPLQVAELLFQVGHRRQLSGELLQLLPRRERIGQLLVEPLEFLPRRHDRLLRHAALAVERQRALAPRHPFGPARLFPGEGLLCRLARRIRRPRRPPRRREPLLGGPPLAREARRIGQPGLEAAHLGRQRVPHLAHALLRVAQPLVAEHARQERRPLGPAERRHHGQLLLPREIGVEEFLVGHSERALELVRHRLERVRHELPVLLQRRGREAPRHAVLVRAEAELELHLDAGAALRPEPADRVPVAAHRLDAVERPGDGLQNGGLPGAVRAEDSGDARTEHELGVGMLPEVDEPEPMQLHQASPPPPPSAPPACST